MCWRHAWVPAIVATLVCANAAESPDRLSTKKDCSTVSSNAVPVGVNRANLAREKNFKNILESIKISGVQRVRVTLDSPFQVSSEAVAYASSLGLEVLLNVPLWAAEFVSSTAHRRAGLTGTEFFPIYKLSDLDLEKYRETFAAALRDIEERGGRVAAFEIGNEINWAAFNGDLPLTAPGKLLGRDSEEIGEIEIGLMKYAKVLHITREILYSSAHHQSSKILSAGLVSSISQPNLGTLVPLPQILQLFDDYGISEKVDAVALHIYPADFEPTSGIDGIISSLDRISSGCRSWRPCWITEWGFRSGSKGCSVDDSRRFLQVLAFRKAISCLAKTHYIQMSYLFDWDKSSEYSVYRCDRPLETVKALQ